MTNSNVSIFNAQLNKSRRYHAVSSHFTSEELFNDVADQIEQDIVEGHRSWTGINLFIAGIGEYDYDREMLQEFAAKIKEHFNQIDHLRFYGQMIVIDTKPNTWARRRFSGPIGGL